jgi:hypothetical protein
MILIKKGTVLYRFGSIRINECTDTGKKGIYFSLNKEQSELMSVEWQRDGVLNTIVLNEDYYVQEGKYSYRTDRYFDSNGRLIPNMFPTEEENISHIDQNCSVPYKGKQYGPFNEVFFSFMPNYNLEIMKIISYKDIEKKYYD